MITSNRRVFLAIFLSLAIFFGIKYISSNPQLIRPENIFAKISSIKFPDFSKLFTLNFNPSNNVAMKQFSNSNNSFSLSSVPQNASPTYEVKRLPTTSPKPTLKPYIKPINIPQPTEIPKPTSPPPITSDIRPGTTLGEIFDNVSKRMCVPAALLRAFQEEETGPWFHFDENPVPYNTYGWWTTTSPNPCYKGFGYDALTGYFPADSYDAGKFCMKTPGANPGIMGLFAVDQLEQDASRKNTIAILPNNIDRRVIFDCAVIFASITINRVGNQASDCGEDWSDTAVSMAAAKHVSGRYPCQNATCEKYVSDILSFYKKYK